MKLLSFTESHPVNTETAELPQYILQVLDKVMTFNLTFPMKDAGHIVLNSCFLLNKNKFTLSMKLKR